MYKYRMAPRKNIIIKCTIKKVKKKNNFKVLEI